MKLTNSDKFAYLVNELERLLRAYMHHADSKEYENNQITYYALLNTLMSLEMLQLYANDDEQAKAFYEAIMERHLAIVEKTKKH